MSQGFDFNSGGLDCAVEAPISTGSGGVNDRRIELHGVTNGVIATETIYHSTLGYGTKRWVFTDPSKLMEFLSDWAVEVMSVERGDGS